MNQRRWGKSVDDCLEVVAALPKRVRYTFFSTLIVGFMAHGYAFVNKIPNSDDLLAIRAYGAGISYGRWLQQLLGPVVSKFAGNYTNPWIEGIISMVLLAIAACVIVEALDIKHVMSGMLIGGLLSSFPTIMGNYTYMFIAIYFHFAILLASVAVWLTVRKGWGAVVVAGLLIACSMGIYQAYFPLTASLLLISLIVRIFRGKEKSIRDIWTRAIRYFSCLLTGIIFYFIIEKVCLLVFHEEFSTFRGMDSIGQLKTAALPVLIARMYQNMVSMLFRDFYGFSGDLSIRILIGMAWGTVILFAAFQVAAFVKKKKYAELFTGVFFVGIFPIAINLMDIMTANSSQNVIYSLMEYSFVCIFILPVACLDGTEKNVLQWGTVFFGALTVYYYVNVANEVYLYNDLANRSIVSAYNSMITQIRELDGYTSDMEVVFVGKGNNALYPLEEEFDAVYSGTTVSYANSSKYGRMKYYCGFWMEEGLVYPEEYEEEIEDMPCYPDDGSIKIIGEQVIVKLSN